MMYSLLTGKPSSFDAVDNTITGVGYHHKAPNLVRNGRLIQTHEPYRKEYNKAIYIVRDVRDVLISQYQYDLSYGYYTGSFDRYFEHFTKGTVSRYGFWGDHVASWLEAKSSGIPVQIIRFEDLKSDPNKTLQESGTFLSMYWSEETVQTVVSCHTISDMKAKEKESSLKKARSNSQGFVRKGATGQWEEYLSDKQMNELTDSVSSVLHSLGYQ